MKKIVIFAGTTEGKALSEGFANAGIPNTVCVATEYGELVMHPHPLVKINSGRLDLPEMKDFLKKTADVVFDATHPFAKLVTQNIKIACEESGIEYIRILRMDVLEAAINPWKGNSGSENSEPDGNPAGNKDISINRKSQKNIMGNKKLITQIEKNKIRFFENTDDCAQALKNIKGNILLTTGSKEIAKYAACEEVRSRLYARVLPSEESIRLCNEAGIFGKQIIAMHGPFDTALNEALIKQFDISCLVTKQSGVTGGFYEKLEAALNMDIQMFVIGKPKEESGYTVEEVLERYGIKSGSDITNTDCSCVEKRAIEGYVTKQESDIAHIAGCQGDEKAIENNGESNRENNRGSNGGSNGESNRESNGESNRGSNGESNRESNGESNRGSNGESNRENQGSDIGNIADCSDDEESEYIKLNISLIGYGPGDKGLLTVNASEAIEQADIVFGSERLVGKIEGKRTYPYYLARDVIPVIEQKLLLHNEKQLTGQKLSEQKLSEQKLYEHSEYASSAGKPAVGTDILKAKKIAILFSGDSGFFSGTEKMKTELSKWAETRSTKCSIEVYPGISSLVYLAARAQEAYQEYPFLSLHGRGDENIFANVISEIRYNDKVFLIMSGASDVQKLGDALLKTGLDECRVILGFELSYPEEKVLELSPEECMHIDKKGLYAAIIKNPNPEKKRLVQFLSDEMFERTVQDDGKSGDTHRSFLANTFADNGSVTGQFEEHSEISDSNKHDNEKQNLSESEKSEIADYANLSTKGSFSINWTDTQSEIANYADLSTKGVSQIQDINQDKEKLNPEETENNKPTETYRRSKKSDNDAPMTKEMIRHASIIRLDLKAGDILYDVGSGTGSVSVEAALLDPTVKVYAIEKKEAAIKLTKQNAQKFGCCNIEVVSGEAPEALKGLDPATHVFIGGSGGNLREILEAVKRPDRKVRVVINAVTLETISEIQGVIKALEDEGMLEKGSLIIEQLSVSKARKLGKYHLLTAENPVMIFTFTMMTLSQ